MLAATTPALARPVTCVALGPTSHSGARLAAGHALLTPPLTGQGLLVLLSAS